MPSLELGCGHRKEQGAVGLDLHPWPAVDVVADLDRPLPFGDDSFSAVWARHILEHVADISFTLGEIHRVCAPGARVHIVTPHFSSANSWTDPTHRRHFGLYAFDFYCPDPDQARPLRFRFRVLERRLDFLPRTIQRWIPWLANRFPRSWEKYYCYRWPARNIFITLEVLK